MRPVLCGIPLLLITACRGTGVGASVDVETIPSRTVRGQLVYAAKFLCGTIPPKPGVPEFPGTGIGDTAFLSPGTYLTAVNIHNPDTIPVSFLKRAAVSRHQTQRHGPVSEFSGDTLRWDESLEVDCPDILRLLHDSLPLERHFVKGFVVLRTNAPLDVVGVYTFKNVER